MPKIYAQIISHWIEKREKITLLFICSMSVDCANDVAIRLDEQRNVRSWKNTRLNTSDNNNGERRQRLQNEIKTKSKQGHLWSNEWCLFSISLVLFDTIAVYLLLLMMDFKWWNNHHFRFDLNTKYSDSNQCNFTTWLLSFF